MATTASIAPLTSHTFGKDAIASITIDTKSTLGNSSTPYKSQWKYTEAISFTRENSLESIHRKTPTIRSTGFLTTE
ncbi:hypothetical protein SBOR_9611 [Sclerotinia borealis F-4128]|uniref:Uncharacterized protein n=1 Tax=Sclerotinia borealis (strain F-4128) TaxID=1432307 RepID=W9C2S7_SCLBF|nr:hypothetical protein SBOR_9611 [Sclerotinia borealis F-4128]